MSIGKIVKEAAYIAGLGLIVAGGSVASVKITDKICETCDIKSEPARLVTGLAVTTGLAAGGTASVVSMVEAGEMVVKTIKAVVK